MPRKQTALRRRIPWIFAAGLAGCTALAFWHHPLPVAPREDVHLPSQISRHHVSQEMKRAVGLLSRDRFFPSEIELPVRGTPTKCILQYSIQPKLQLSMEALFDAYRPDFGAFVAIDPDTGRVLSLVSYANNQREYENFALKADLPSASVFKVVTATAAIAKRRLSPDSIIPFNGMNHTLYRKNVFDPRVNRWTRFMTMREAFAKSVNTVFARIGTFFVSPQDLREAAESFGFNRKIASDLPFDMGRAEITNDSWQLAGAASGYTQENTMSPLQGALIAAAVANDGKMMEPYIVENVLTEQGASLYSAHPELAGTPMDAETAGQVRRLMQETVTHGTARGAFRRFFTQSAMARGLEVGGKTGSLSGHSPEGKYDWFVGYAKGHGQRIAFAALTINKKFWKVKSAYLGRRAIEAFFASESQITMKQPSTNRANLRSY